jgi:hypothetical protein
VTAKTLTNLAVLTRSVEELEAGGISFSDELDDLGPARTAHISIGDRRFVVDHIDGSPNARVSVARLGPSADPVGDLGDLLANIDVPPHVVCRYRTGTRWVEGPPGYQQHRSA